MTHYTLKSLPTKMRFVGTPKGTTVPLTPALATIATAAADEVQEFAMRMIDQAVTRYFEALTEEKQHDTRVTERVAMPAEKDWPYDIDYVNERWGSLCLESRLKAEDHLARCIQSLRGEVGPNDLNRVGFEFIECGL